MKALRALGGRPIKLAVGIWMPAIVAKWSRGTYQCDGRDTSWLKIKNLRYSQAEGRHELFEAARRRPSLPSRRGKTVPPALALR